MLFRSSFHWTGGRENEAGKLVQQVEKVLRGTRRYVRTRQDGFLRDLADQLCEDDDDDLYRALQCNREDDDVTWDQFQVLIGRALGQFDLVVLDEAHKARRTDSSISRILGRMLWKRDGCFHLGLTATPIELDNSQWKSTLERLALPPDALTAISDATKAYDEALAELWRGALTEEAIKRFAAPAQRMADTLRPWMLRRDLRDDPFLREFGAATGGLGHRDRRAIPVEFGSMDITWKRAFMASEALALRSGTGIALGERRQRVRMATGIDGDPAIISEQGHIATNPAASAWRRLAIAPLAGNGSSQYRHPLLTKAIELVEERTARGEKVLVFGRFNAPLKALVHLLDMRELVRRLSDPSRFEWPQRFLSEEQKRAFVVAFGDGVGGCEVASADEIDSYLGRKYEQRVRQRRAFRQEATDAIDKYLREHELSGDKDRATGLWHALEAQVVDEVGEDQSALQRVLEKALVNLIDICREDSDESMANPNGALDTRLDEFLSDLTIRTGHFASFLYGDLKPQTRRNLQIAFNQEESWPRVLVAQSRVASEGLNLQGACRSIVMFHPEWNPAICEQQIGRVDRLGSLWRRMAGEYLKALPGVNGPAPRISVLMPYIEGTYAEHNLRVLEARWDRLRGQLHGDIVAPGFEIFEDEESTRLAEMTRELAPRFAP